MVLVGALSLAPALAAAATFPSQTGGVPSQTGGIVPSQVGGPTVAGIQNPLGQTDSICKLIKALFSAIIMLGIPVATLFIVYAGFRLVVARGRPEALKKARENLMWTIIGVGIFLGAWMLAQVISNTLAALGVQILGSC